MQEWLFLFTWPDWYYLSQELRKWQWSFWEKFGNENCLVFTNDTISLQAIQESLQWWWLFATKKLIICKGIPDDKATWDKPSKQIASFFEELLDKETQSFSSDVILVFVSVDPDKRLRLYKILEKKAHVKSFPALNDKQIMDFIKEKLGTYHNANLWEYLLSFVGNDLFRMEQECDKIVQYLTYTNQKQLSEEEKQSIIYTTIEANSFGVLDALTAWEVKKALKLIDAVSWAETARPEFLGTLYRGLKHMLQTVDLYSRDVKSAKEISAAIGMHFFPIIKNLKHIDFLSQKKNAFANIFHRCLLLDSFIKSWSFPAEWFWSEIKIIIYSELEGTKPTS